MLSWDKTIHFSHCKSVTLEITEAPMANQICRVLLSHNAHQGIMRTLALLIHPLSEYTFLTSHRSVLVTLSAPPHTPFSLSPCIMSYAFLLTLSGDTCESLCPMQVSATISAGQEMAPSQQGRRHAWCIWVLTLCWIRRDCRRTAKFSPEIPNEDGETALPN